MTVTAAELRETARAHYAEEAASFERCDTDGFVSQWASNMNGQLAMARAELVEAGGVAEFPALFDTAGRLVAAKLVHTRYGAAWGLLPDDDPHGTFTGWFSPSKARDEVRAAATNRRKGYYVGRVTAPANATIHASGTGLSGAASARVITVRTDGGFSRNVTIVDNGQPAA